MKQKQIIVDAIFKNFKVGPQDVEVLKGISFEVETGDFVVIFGPSGCGKSTLLHTILGLEKPTHGNVSILGENLYQKKDGDFRSEFRKKHIGMVYQQSNWIKSLTVVENVAFPLLLLGQNKLKSLAEAKKMLDFVGMVRWAGYISTELSSGQQQRVALARAIITNPEIIIADEPTGNLDFEAGQMVMEIFKEFNQSQGKTIIMVTHDLEYLDYAKKVVHIFDGQLYGIYKGKDKKKLLRKIKTKKKIIGDVNIDKNSKIAKIKSKKQPTKQNKKL